MAGAISFNGLGSGLDFSQLTEAILAERSRPLTRLQSKGADFSKRSDALKQLNARLLALTNAAKALTDRSLGTSRQASSSDANVATVTSSADAVAGTINLNVTRLATSLAQASRVYADDTSAVLANGATSATFELRKGDATSGAVITIDSTNNTLTGLRDAINEANAGVTAAVVDVDGTGTQFKLVLNSTATGAAGRVQLVETSATGTGTDLNLTSLNPPGATTDFSTLDAAFTINGLPLTRATNSVSDAVTGLTFSLKDTGTASIAVTAKTSEVSDKLNAFIKAYNEVQDFIAGQYAKDGTGRPTGVLAGDPTLRLAQRQLRDAIGGSSTNNGGDLTNLTQLGVSRDDNGKLTLDATVLNEKLSDSFADVQALLAGKDDNYTGLANNLYNTYDRLSNDVTGLVKTAINGYADSIKRINNSINDQLARLSTLRESLTRQFAAADAAIGQLNGQGTALTNLLKSLEPKSK
jgi:flagellar hook-associated protein 2